MQFKSLALATAAVGLAVAQRPNGTSICDYYTTALLKNNTAANQATLLTLIVNTAVIGNYTKPNVGVSVPGILAKGMYNGTAVNLLPYFNGGLASTNRGGDSGVSVNFLDGGGAAPLMENKPANDDSSMQYMLLTHLYEYFGVLLGCTMQGNDAFATYAADGSMYDVHKFMDLSAAEVGYFITQVALAGASFGVAADDLTGVGKALNGLFGYKCSPPAVVVPAQGAQLQAICIGDGCPTAPMPTCAAYGAAVMMPSVVPSNASATATGMASGTGAAASKTMSAGAHGTSSAAAVSSTAASDANTVGLSLAAVAGGFAVLLL